MPRNAAGVYSLPEPPYVAGNTIIAADENATNDDIAAELTNSLDRSGRGGMTGVFKITDGTVLAPGIGFTTDPDNGAYLIGSDEWGLTSGGVNVMTITPTGVTFPLGVKGTIQIEDGTAAAPSLAFASEPATGMYLAGPEELAFSVNGVPVMNLANGAGFPLGVFSYDVSAFEDRVNFSGSEINVQQDTTARFHGNIVIDNVITGTARTITIDTTHTLTCAGGVYLTSTLSVTGAAVFNGTISAAAANFVGAVTMSTTLGVTGAATFSSTTTHTGAATFNSTALFNGAVTSTSTISSSGAIGLTGSAGLNITGTGSIDMTGTTGRIATPNTSGSIANATAALGGVLQAGATAADAAYIAFLRAGTFGCYFGMSNSGSHSDLCVGGWSYGANEYRVLTEFNSFAVLSATSLYTTRVISMQGPGSNTAQLVINDSTNTSYGCGISLTGNGSNPSKHIRVKSGALDVMNHAYTVAIFSIADSGIVSVVGSAAGTCVLALADQSNGNGCGLQLTGNGASTPAKTIRVNSGVFEVINDAYTTALLSITDAGVATIPTAGSLKVGSNQVVAARRTGWGAPTGTATRTTFATGSVTLPQLAERVKALIDDLTTHGLIGT